MSLDSINGRSIQTLLRGENKSKQSDEFQATVVVDQLVEGSQQKLIPPGQPVFPCLAKTLSSSTGNRQFDKRKVNIQYGSSLYS